MNTQQRTCKQARFSCPVEGCTRDFSRKDNLNQHLKTSHSEVSPEEKSRNYKCDISSCELSFFHANHLIKHLEEEHKVTVGMLLVVFYDYKIIVMIMTA